MIINKQLKLTGSYKKHLKLENDLDVVRNEIINLKYTKKLLAFCISIILPILATIFFHEKIGVHFITISTVLIFISFALINRAKLSEDDKNYLLSILCTDKNLSTKFTKFENEINICLIEKTERMLNEKQGNKIKKEIANDR